MSVDNKNAGEKTYNVENYDKDSSSIDPQLFISLTTDFPKDIGNKRIEEMTIREINYLLYDQSHEASLECYMECLETFTENLWFYDKRSAHMVLETSFSDVSALLKRVRDIIKLKERTSAEDSSNPLDTAWHLLNKLSAIIDCERQMKFIEDGIDQIQNKVDEVETALSSSKEKIKAIEKDVSKVGTALSDTLSDAVSDANKDMISVMGIFTSIVVVVMSLVITSSSWLNNASGASALIAFIVPSCVAILTVCALTFFLNLLTKNKSEKIIPWLVVGGMTLLIGCVAIFCFSKKEVLPHNRLIFEVDKYVVDDPNDTNGERIINIQFAENVETSDGIHAVEVVIDHQRETDCIIHNNLIYYCVTHNKFE